MVILNYFDVKQKMRVYIVTINMHIMQIFNMHVYVCIYIHVLNMYTNMEKRKT